jgi:glutaminyl-peptide cyclotransferase
MLLTVRRRQIRVRVLVLCAGLHMVLACSGPSPATQPSSDKDQTPPAAAGPVVYGYRVVNTYPHDPEAFTQGLVFDNGDLYEGTGLYGGSSIRQVELETGNVIRSVILDGRYFGEGITILHSRLIQLTWREGVGLIYDLADLKQSASFAFPTEGWGLTHDGHRLIASNGSSTLFYLDPQTMAIVDQISVHAPEGPVTALNELEWVAGEIFANVWLTDRIVRISPIDGQVTGRIDLTGLLPPADRLPSVDVLNGIAYDAAGQRLFVTGKLWPKLFEIELVAPD